MSKLIDMIQSTVNGKSFEYQENHTSVHGWLRNRKGNLFYVERGSTGIASISILSETEIQISVPYSAYYERQIYWGLRNEYQPEQKSPWGIYNSKISLMPFINVQFVGISDFGPMKDPGHDSNVMTVRGLEKHIISNLYNSLKNYAGVENELLELYKKLTSILKASKKYDPSHNVKYVFHAKSVQIIGINNGNIIDQLKIEDFMSDTYNVGQAGAVGKYARSDGNTFIQSEQKQDLAEAAKKIQELLQQLEETNPNATEGEQIAYVNDKIPPSLKSRLAGALQAGSEAAIEEFLGNPYVNVAKAIIKGWIKPE